MEGGILIAVAVAAVTEELWFPLFTECKQQAMDDRMV